jgi:hypothetical protein
MCVRVCFCGVPCCTAGSYPGLFGEGEGGRLSCLCMTQMQQSPCDVTDIFLNVALTTRDVNDSLSWPRDATRTSPFENRTPRKAFELKREEAAVDWW